MEAVAQVKPEKPSLCTVYRFNLALTYLFLLRLPVPSFCAHYLSQPFVSFGLLSKPVVPSDVDKLTKCYCKELTGLSNCENAILWGN